MFKTRFALSTFVALCCCFFTAYAADAFADDYGDDFGDAEPIVVDGGPLAGRIDAVGDVDFFKIEFDDPETGEIQISLRRWFPEMTPFLAIYDDSGKLLQWGDGQPESDEIHFALLPGDNDFLYASVEDVGAGGTGAYQMSVETPDNTGVMWNLVSVSTEQDYRFDTAREGARTYIDRHYRIRQLSRDLKNGVLLRTANDDKYNHEDRHLVLNFNQTVDLYVCYDKRGASKPPEWLTSEGWTRTDDSVTTSDRGASPYRVFHKKVFSGETVLGGNHAGEKNRARSNYFLIAKPSRAEVQVPRVVELLYVSNSKPYSLDTVRRNSRPYIDRGYSIREISANLNHGVMVKTANDDKYNDEEVHLVLYFHQSATVYLCYDKRGRELPFWLQDGEWIPTAERMKTSDYRAGPMKVYEQHVEAESELAFGGNYAGDARGAHSNYFLVIQPDERPPETGSFFSLTGGVPVDRLGSGGQTDAVTEPGQWRWAENYYGYKGIDRIKWKRDRCGRWHNYAIGWHRGDLAEYLMKFGGRYNNLILRGIADRPGPVTVAIYVDAEKVATAEFDNNDNCNQDVAVRIDGIAYGTHAIAVKFVNDRYKRNRYDRNLYLDGLKAID